MVVTRGKLWSVAMVALLVTMLSAMLWYCCASNCAVLPIMMLPSSSQKRYMVLQSASVKGAVGSMTATADAPFGPGSGVLM
jgi:hypothetical protein